MSPSPSRNPLLVFGRPKMAALLFLGFSSGLPLYLTKTTLQAWMTTAGVSLTAIGVFSLLNAPYSLKFVWAPVLDRYVPPFLGRRRGWMLITQILLLVSIALMSLHDPKAGLMALGINALIIAFLSASQDITIDAYRTDILTKGELGPGTSVYVLGYRIALILTGWLALVLADRLSWPTTYVIMSTLMIVGIITTFRSPEPVLTDPRPASLTEAVVLPFKEFFQRSGFVPGLVTLLFIVLYKLPDSLTDNMKTSFLLKTGFSQTEIGAVLGFAGIVATIVGGVLAGAVIVRLGVNKSLWVFAVFQALSNLSYYVLALAGKSHALMVTAVITENFGLGMVSAGLLAFMMAVCNKRFSATQFALLSSLMAASRDILVAPAGKIAETTGWPGFFLFTVVSALPALVLLPVVAPWARDMPRFAADRESEDADEVASLEASATDQSDGVGPAGRPRT
ncbi:MAG: AmpG family muropeptide MFS transporter [Gemmatimonadaceae bacterium]